MSSEKKESGAVDNTRQMFETWAAFDCLVYEFDRNDDGTYVNEHVQSMWIGYEQGDRERRRIAAANERIRQIAHEVIDILQAKSNTADDEELAENAFQLRDLLNETDADESLFERHVVPAWLAKETFAIQYNPNCPSRYLVRLPGFLSGSIDMKSYYREPPEGTKDALGFGNSIVEAAVKAKAEQESARVKVENNRRKRV